MYGDWSQVDAIARLNNIGNKDVIFPGMVLTLPAANVATTGNQTAAVDLASGWKKTDRLVIGGLVLAGVAVGYVVYKTKKKSVKK